MEYEDYVKMGLDGEEPLKIVLCGGVEVEEDSKVGVVSVVYISTNKDEVERVFWKFVTENPDNYYMVYSVPFDTDLTNLEHFPSIEITKEDLKQNYILALRVQIPIEQNRCAMACQGCGAVLLY